MSVWNKKWAGHGRYNRYGSVAAALTLQDKVGAAKPHQLYHACVLGKHYFAFWK